MRAFLLVFPLFLPSILCLSCPKEFSLINGQKCVKVFRVPATHWEAERNCVSIGGTLAIVKNAIDNRALFNLANNAAMNRIWLGLSCFGDTLSSCFWDDASGSPIQTIYNNFAPGFPSSKSGNCISMYVSIFIYGIYQGRWASENCDNTANSTQTLPYICEAPPTYESTCINNYFFGCYNTHLGTTSATYASTSCLMISSNLTSIHSKMEIDWIKNLYKGTNTTHIYIGAQLKKTQTTSRFEWLDGSTWNFDYFDPLNFGKGDCLVMDVQGDGLWSQVDCNQNFEFLCRKSIIPPKVEELLIEKQRPKILLDGSNCNSTLYLAPGSISSFGYPAYNSPPTYCTWQLRALGPYRLGIYFDFWATYGGLNIYDEFGTNIGQFIWPYNREPFARYTPFNIATVTFQPGTGPEVDRGFHATVLPI